EERLALAPQDERPRRLARHERREVLLERDRPPERRARLRRVLRRAPHGREREEAHGEPPVLAPRPRLQRPRPLEVPVPRRHVREQRDRVRRVVVRREALDELLARRRLLATRE